MLTRKSRRGSASVFLAVAKRIQCAYIICMYMRCD